MYIFRREIVGLIIKDKDLGMEGKYKNRKLGWGQLVLYYFSFLKELRREMEW